MNEVETLIFKAVSDGTIDIEETWRTWQSECLGRFTFDEAMQVLEKHR